MADTIIGFIFCLVGGLLGLGVAGSLVLSGKVIHSIDDLFLVLASLLFSAVCFGYLAQQILSSSGDKK